MPEQGSRSVEDVLAEHRERLMVLSGVAGVGSGEREGVAVILVFVERTGVDGIPDRLGEYDVVVEQTGEFHALG